MSENGGSTRSHAARALLVSAVLLLGASGLMAQGTTGKVQGTVLDPTGQPLANAQVFVLGTSFAAFTNQDGFYFVNNVPAGVYSMRAQFIGYQPAQMDGVRILADQTLTADFRLSGAVALEAITITAAEAPIVPRDQVTSKSIVEGGVIDQLPVENAFNVVQLQPGVVVARNGNLAIRGSRQNEAVIFIDGAPVRRLDTGATLLNLGTNTLQEVSVTTGAMDAAFGDAQAGVISFVSRSGGPGYTGTLSYETDEPFGNSISVGLNRFEASLSGPVFGNLTFAVGGALAGQQTDIGNADVYGLGFVLGKGTEDVPYFVRGGVDTVVTQLAANSTTDSVTIEVPQFVQYSGKCNAADNHGYECQGRRQPLDWTTDLRLTGKLQYTYGSGSRVSVSGFTNRTQGLNNVDLFGNDVSLNADAVYGFRVVSNMAVVNWVQQVFRSAVSELAFDVNLSYQTDQIIAGPTGREDGLALRAPTMGISLSPLDFAVDFDHYSDATGENAVTQLKTPEDWDQLVRNFRTGEGTRLPYFLRAELNESAFPRMNAYGLVTTIPGNYNTGFLSTNGMSSVNQLSTILQQERRFTFRGNVDWQAGRYNRFKFGGEGLVGRLNRANVGWTGFDFDQIYAGEPVKYAAYGQDRLDLGDVVLELGVRWDYYDSKALFPQVPGRVFTNPTYDPAVPPEEQVGPRGDTTSVFYRAEAHSTLSPRLRVSFPVTDKTGFRLSYAHQVQAPTFNNIYAGTNSDASFANTNTQFGGDADFGKTIVFEFGIRHAFSPDLVLDIAAYNKDKVSDVTYRILPFFDPFVQTVINRNVLTNADFGTARGVDLQLLYKASDLFSGQLSYTFQTAKSTGSDPADYLNGLSRQPSGVLGGRPEPPQAIIRTRDDRRHNLQGSFALTFPSDFAEGSLVGTVLRDVGLFGTFQFRTGLPYTPILNTGLGCLNTAIGVCSGTLAGDLQSRETPFEKYFDLRITKGFRLGRLDWTVYADVRNLFNFENQPILFIETGDVTNENFFRSLYLSPQLQGLRSDAEASNALTATGAIALPADCSRWLGQGLAAGCVLLKRAEMRFGNGDELYDLDEQTAAITAYYEWNSGAHIYTGQSRHIRLGAQVTF